MSLNHEHGRVDLMFIHPFPRFAGMAVNAKPTLNGEGVCFRTRLYSRFDINRTPATTSIPTNRATDANIK